ncbi:hypothetical protein LZ554_005112 [Drepanopeziza brunnea f. sp. 'monogermtubi']|nr:hypothetical protein LZ554_005112 [Drepanopeziza brunnea f. sp. 'monogermtubi']
MGACCSAPAGSSEPPQRPNDPNSSSHAINTTQPVNASHGMLATRPSTNASNHSPPTATCHDHGSGRDAIGLKPLVWESKNRTWTRSQIDEERIAFFDTRVTGKDQLWQVLRAALEILWSEGGPEDTDGGLATASSMLDAAGFVHNNGQLSPVVWDFNGERYEIPPEIVSYPTNLVDESGDITAESEDELRQEKGKAVLDPNDEINVNVKLSNRGEVPLMITILKQDPVRLVTKTILEKAQLPPTTNLKIIYLGRHLKDEKKTLMAHGWNGTYPLQAMIVGSIPAAPEEIGA